MALHEFTPAPSRRFIRAYLVIWGVAAVGALGYLATLALQPESFAPSHPKLTEPDPSLRPPPRRWPRSARCARPSIPCRRTSAT